MSVVSSVRHYQKSIEKCQGDRDRILHCINRLYDLPVTVQHLQDTGVGKTVNSLRKSEGEIGNAAKALVAKWKQMVEDEPETEAQHIEDDPYKNHHQDKSKWSTDGRDNRDKYRTESKAGSSHNRGHLNDNSQENRKRKKESDRNLSQGKRRHVESEDEGIDEDDRHYETTADSDSEHLHIEETGEYSEETSIAEEPGNSKFENSEMLSVYSDKTSQKLKSERLSSDEEHQSTSSYTHNSSEKESKQPEKSYSHRSHEKSNKKDKHISDSKCTKKSSSKTSSQTGKIKSDLQLEHSSSRESERTKDSSNKSNVCKSRERECSSSSNRHHGKVKDKTKENDGFDIRQVKSERFSDTFDVTKVKTEKSEDTFDLKKVKSETSEKESKPSSKSYHKEQKPQSNSSKSSLTDISSKSTEKAKHKDKEKKSKHKEKHNSKDERKSKDKKKDKERNKLSEVDEDGVDSFSGTSFAEALGMCVPEKPRKKSSQGLGTSSPSSSKSQKLQSNSLDVKTPIKDLINSPHELERHCASVPLEPLDVDEDFCLPALNPNYKPLPQLSHNNSSSKKAVSEDEALTNIMYSKVQRTKVFSGNKTGYTSVPSLFDLCTRVLQENIDALEYTGGVPFDLLKPVLERATPDQLFTLEDYNAYLIEDTDVLWEFHCKKDFRNKKREEMETWREMYLRCREERERKLKALTVNIAAANKAKALPVRKTQLAYVEGTVKPPRNIARKQAKFGTANPSTNSVLAKQSQSSTPPGSPGLSSSFTGRPAASVSQGPAVSVPTPRGSAGGHQSSTCKPKPKAPLMQKALQLIKYNRFKR